MPETEAEIGSYKIGVACSEPPAEDLQPRRVEVLTRWLLETFNRQRKEASNVEPRSAG